MVVMSHPGMIQSANISHISHVMMVVKARQTSPDAASDIVPHLVSIHRSNMSLDLMCAHSTSGDAVRMADTVVLTQ